MSRSGNMPGLPFPRRANIDNLQLAFPLVELVHTHLSYLCLFKSRRFPRFHSADQIAGEFRVTGANKKPNDILEIIFIFEHEQDWLIRSQHPARPDGKNRRAADVQRARNMAAAK